jgi:hypothetical protein
MDDLDNIFTSDKTMLTNYKTILTAGLTTGVCSVTAYYLGKYVKEHQADLVYELIRAYSYGEMWVNKWVSSTSVVVHECPFGILHCHNDKQQKPHWLTGGQTVDNYRLSKAMIMTGSIKVGDQDYEFQFEHFPFHVLIVDNILHDDLFRFYLKHKHDVELAKGSPYVVELMDADFNCYQIPHDGMAKITEDGFHVINTNLTIEIHEDKNEMETN